MDMMTLNEVTMSSLEIAELTGKQHYHVLRDIENMLKELNPNLDSLTKSNTYKDSNGIDRKCYNLTRELTDCLLTGYSAKLRMAVIKRWHELEAQPKPQTSLEVLQSVVNALVEQERKQKETDERLLRIEAKQTAFEEGYKYFTILGYCAYKGITIDLSAGQKLGRQATKLSRDKEVPIDKVKDARFGHVHAYHESILDECIATYL